MIAKLDAERARSLPSDGLVAGSSGNQPTSLDAPEPHADLTPRERAVVAQLLGGRSVAEIASELVVEVSTVRTHLKHSRAKSETRGVVELVLWAVDHQHRCVERPTRIPRAS